MFDVLHQFFVDFQENTGFQFANAFGCLLDNLHRCSRMYFRWFIKFLTSNEHNLMKLLHVY